jgi:replicative DNA helicase
VSARDEYAVPDKAPEMPPSRRKKRDDRPAITDGDALHDVSLPAAIDAEKTILGAILLDEDYIFEAIERLQADDFCLDSHKRIYLRMLDISRRRDTLDIVTLANELSQNKEVEYIGGVAYLASLTEGLPMRPVIEDYIRIVKDKAMARRLMIVCATTITRAADQSEPALVTASALGAGLEEVISGSVHRRLVPVDEATVEVLNDFEKQAKLVESPGFSWGVEGIDEATGGIQPGEQAVIGCYSGVGKTTLLAQIVAANCLKGRGVALFLIEPTKKTFLRQLYAVLRGIRYTACTKPWLATSAERDLFRDAAREVAEWGTKLLLFDERNLTLDEEIAHARLAMHRHNTQLIGIDYIQRMQVPATDRNEDMRLRMGRASIANAELVKDTEARTLILSQLNRGGNLESIPTMNMLRESGQLENDATTICLLHLSWDSDLGHFTDEGAGIICKQRFGVPCNVKLFKDPKTAKWCSGEKPEGEVVYEQPKLY